MEPFRKTYRECETRKKYRTELSKYIWDEKTSGTRAVDALEYEVGYWLGYTEHLKRISVRKR